MVTVINLANHINGTCTYKLVINLPVSRLVYTHLYGMFYLFDIYMYVRRTYILTTLIVLLTNDRHEQIPARSHYKVF